MQYNHNFFVIDHEVVGPDMAIKFPFDPRPAQALKNGGEVRGREITYSRELEKGESVFSGRSEPWRVPSRTFTCGSSRATNRSGINHDFYTFGPGKGSSE